MSTRSDISPRADLQTEPTESLRLNFVDFYDIVIGRWRLLFPALAFTFAIALTYTIVAPARYTASLSILVDPRDRVPAGAEAQAMPQTPDPALVESQMRVLTSKAVLRRVVESERLVDDPEFKPGLIRRMIDVVGGIFQAGSPNAQDRVDAVAESLGRLISAKRNERTYVVDVDVAAKTPEMAVRLGNALVAAYFSAQTKLSDEIIDKQTAWLDGRVTDLRTRLEAAERRVQDYRDKNAIALTDGHTSPDQQLGGANAALVAARGKLGEVEARYNQLKTAASLAGASGSIDEAIHSPVIEKLRGDYSALARDEAYELTVLGPRHPTYLTTEAQLSAVRTQIRAEVQRILLATEREYKIAQAAEQAAERLVSNTEASTNKLGDETLELKDLEREAATLRATFEKTLAARENVRRDVVESPLGLVVDPPVAGNSRTSPKVIPAFILALAGGINIWIAAALIADFRERRATPPQQPPPLMPSEAVDKSPQKRSAAFGGFVVLAPRPANWLPPSANWTPSGRDRSIYNAVADAMADRSPYARSIRSLYDRLADHFGDDHTTPRVAIASGSGDAGGAFIALSVAHAACEEGQRVLVVDCDGSDSTLSQYMSEQRRFALPMRRRRFRDNAGRRGNGGGQVVVAPLNRGHGSESEFERVSSFDLLLLCCGSIDIAADSINRWDAADAVVIIANGPEVDVGVVDKLEAARLTDRCIGVVLTSDEERARKQA